jgi:hypothetical protein
LLAIWALGAMWFTTGDNEQKAKNLSANQHCALTTGTDTLTGMDYIIEGTASLVSDQATREAVATAFEQAYGWQLTRERVVPDSLPVELRAPRLGLSGSSAPIVAASPAIGSVPVCRSSTAAGTMGQARTRCRPRLDRIGGNRRCPGGAELLEGAPQPAGAAVDLRLVRQMRKQVELVLSQRYLTVRSR